MLNMLTGGVTLIRDYAIEEHFVVIPHAGLSADEMNRLDAELLDLGLEMLPEEECESTFVHDGVKVQCIDLTDGAGVVSVPTLYEEPRLRIVSGW